MTNHPSVFSFESHADIRTVLINGEPWFFAVDVCRAIGIANHRDAVRKLDDDEKGVGLADTHGGEQESIIISESGLYTLILRCRDAVTPGTIPYRFRKWVTREVLPQIRRTGCYVREEHAPDDRVQKIVEKLIPVILEIVSPQVNQQTDLRYLLSAAEAMLEGITQVEPLLRVADHKLAARFYSMSREYPRIVKHSRAVLSDAGRVSR